MNPFISVFLINAKSRPAYRPAALFQSTGFIPEALLSFVPVVTGLKLLLDDPIVLEADDGDVHDIPFLSLYVLPYLSEYDPATSSALNMYFSI